ncbi:unnamed protein product [Rotaria sordida]|uniref:LicD/FKTN/FKRP nucleotidyltransferase domain-containing protein n=2 Tax=Rotaria sordida TaxID=392033 RepID=A0A814B015_9BILA|nr:unnamed protein product [Rotaria sordida]CAF0919142.1 unnamed protein product [Rotaria sordida]CAF0944431.1 unnamed protein product [Rotaria sordida]CAF1216055.1 unnamed protein product [Rotaria sordida]CAF3922342.1 unnamed protein product [Rotaria sordida]
MDLIRLLKHYKLFMAFCLFIYILFWLIVGIFEQSKKLNEISVSYHINTSIANINFILKYLSKFHINLLLIDPFLLDYLFIRQLSFQKLQKHFITFGISYDSIAIIHSLFSVKKFSLTISKSFKNTSIDHIFIEYNQQYIHLAILHEEKSYFLIRKNTAQLPIDIKLSYGDTLRIIEPIELEFMKDKFSFAYPRNVSHFLWLYNTSEFLECNRNLANQMEKKFSIYQNSSQVNLTILPMRNIANILNKLEKHYWLAGGTLLGWYRHCGLIPYTQDVDFGLFAEEYDENIRNYFLGNPIVFLWGALGLVNDSLEFRLFTGHYTFDLFWAYREGDHRWCGYQAQRVKYRRILPLLPKLCSCDLFGYRFSIPCSPIDYLNNEYGYDLWKNPLVKNYIWTNIEYHSIWDDISWMYAVRLYTSQGKLRQDKYAIEWIANQSNYSLKTIPSFLNVLPNEPVTLPPIKN